MAARETRRTSEREKQERGARRRACFPSRDDVGVKEKEAGGRRVGEHSRPPSLWLVNLHGLDILESLHSLLTPHSTHTHTHTLIPSAVMCVCVNTQLLLDSKSLLEHSTDKYFNTSIK